MKPLPREEALGEDALLLRYAFTAQLVDDAARARCLALLLPEERARHARFHFDRDRDAYLLAHAIVNATLAELSGVAAAELRFEQGAQGRPELIQTPGRPRLRFNLSHTDGLVAAAFALEHDVGVDVEHLDRNTEIETVAPRVFSPRERAGLAQLPTDLARRERFFQLWTLKEAYIKAIGKGLSAPLREITFEPGDGASAPRVELGPGVEDDAARYRFGVCPLGGRHVLGWALACAAPRRVAIEAHRVP